MYPTSATCLMMGRRLLSDLDHDVSLYCPNETHLRQAGTVPTDLRLASLGLGTNVHIVENLDSLDTMDFILFPTLDVLPFNTRAQYAQMCRSLFRLANIF